MTERMFTSMLFSKLIEQGENMMGEKSMNLAEKLFDEYLHISTEIDEDGGKPRREIFSGYVPSSYHFLDLLFAKLPFEPEDHLVDFGCGKGRVLFMAALNSCNQVTGYEIDDEICEILAENIKNYQKKFGNETTFNIRRDVLKMNLDEIQDANKFFFFHPFHLKVFIPVMRKILSSAEKEPRKITIYLYRPYKSIIGYMESLKEIKREMSIDTHFYSTELDDVHEGPQIYIYSNQPMNYGLDEHSFVL